MFRWLFFSAVCVNSIFISLSLCRRGAFSMHSCKNSWTLQNCLIQLSILCFIQNFSLEDTFSQFLSGWEGRENKKRNFQEDASDDVKIQMNNYQNWHKKCVFVRILCVSVITRKREIASQEKHKFPLSFSSFFLWHKFE